MTHTQADENRIENDSAFTLAGCLLNQLLSPETKSNFLRLRINTHTLLPALPFMQQYLKFGITCGIVGILILGCSPFVQSKQPIQIENKSTPSESISKPTLPVQKLPVSAQININGQTILLEVARKPEEQSIGLMNRKELAANRGMLFVFSPPRPVSFWMKNTLIPLDMVFVSNGVVKHIGAQIPPCQKDPCPSYGPEPKTDIDSVIELSSGRAAALRLKIGDRLKIQEYSAKTLK